LEILEFDVEEFVTNNEFDLIGNKFVALKAGYYQIDAQFTSESHDCKEVLGIGIYANNVIIAEQSYDHTGDLISNSGGIGARLVCRKISKLVYLNINDYVQIQVKDKNTVLTIDKWKGKTFFTIQRVR